MASSQCYDLCILDLLLMFIQLFLLNKKFRSVDWKTDVFCFSSQTQIHY